MPQPHEQDLFETSTMSFGEHLEELRSCLIKAILWLVLGTCVGLVFGEQVVNLIKLPLQDSLTEYYTTNATTTFEKFAESRRKRDLPTFYTSKQIERLVANGLIFNIDYYYPPELIGAIQSQYPGAFDEQRIPTDPSEKLPPDEERETYDIEEEDPENPDETINKALPYLSASDLVPVFTWRRVEDDPRISIKSLASQEAFMIWLKAGVVAGVIIGSPMIFYHLWSFVAAGLYPHEKQYVNIFLPFSIILFLVGAGFCFLFVLPVVLEFLFDFNRKLGIDPDPRINEWLSFALFLPVGFGISFQLPLVMLFLERVGILTVQAYLEKWRIAVLVIAVISMVLTPADPMSMMMMGIPLVALYFLGIGLCRWLPKSRSPLAA